ncbi:MAG: hypothetical protein QOD99_372 [Chthoniobacter sp.]|jgi:hypothetical protein|nr:hypothetical protein [Chthoniobacter sp.]
MAEKLIILADLGHLKAYRVRRDPMETTPRLELVDEVDLIDAHGRLQDKVTDQAGRFPNAGGGMSIGENHNLLSEMDRRQVKQIAERIDQLVADESMWQFAASSNINARILEGLTAKSRATLKKNVTSDLTKIPKSELLSHF